MALLAQQSRHADGHVFSLGEIGYPLDEQLAAERRVYVLDIRNHGNSPHCEQMDYPAMAADLDTAVLGMAGLDAAELAAELADMVAEELVDAVELVDAAAVAGTANLLTLRIAGQFPGLCDVPVDLFAQPR